MPDSGKARALTVQIEGMACSGCVERVEKAIRATPGVAAASVSLEAKQAEVAFSGPPDLEAVAAAIREAGYEPIIG